MHYRIVAILIVALTIFFASKAPNHADRTNRLLLGVLCLLGLIASAVARGFNL